MTDKAIKVEFGKMLNASRRKKSLTREAVSHGIGVSTRTIANWEKGNTFIEDLSIIDDMIRLYEINIPLLLSDAVEKIQSRKRK